jgi:predicted PurR-regulated permease PerM
MSRPATAPSLADSRLSFSRGGLIRVFLLASALILLFYAGRVFLVAFAGVLVAVVLRAIAGYLERHVPFLGPNSSYAVMLCLILALALGLGYLLVPRVVTQAHEIVKSIPPSIGNIRGALERYEWGRDITRVLDRSMQTQQISGWATKLASAFVQLIADGAVIVVIGLFLGANPALYRKGLLYLIPAMHRDRVDGLLNDVQKCLTGWFLGQLIPMSVLGMGTLLGLWFLGIPLAFTLGLFTSLMLFVPYAGAVAAFLPTALIAFTKSPRSMLYVTLLYLAIHLGEAYVITPLAQRYAVRLPPAVTLLSQLFMWKIAGLLGVLVATPLAAVTLVVVQKLYVKRQ